jgi:hypothetical protein
MNVHEKITAFCMAVALALAVSGCASRPAARSQSVTSLQKIRMNAWNYNEKDDVYWQAGISYAATPADRAYESLGVYVPGKFFNGTKNADGTYTVTVNTKNSVAGFTAATAPYVMPIQTPGYAALEPPAGYQAEVTQYTDAGFIFVYAGARGRDQGAPAGITDFKAAVRYIRYTADELPGNTKRWFTFGMSGGGAQSALMGATGDSPLYDPYLQAIGAVADQSDAVMGSMDWCPITNLNVAGEAYEWELGMARTGLDSATQNLSNGMAVQFAQYIRALGLKDENGTVLTLEPSADGLYHAGSYYDYLKKTIETSLNNFLSDTLFPYSPSEQKAALGQNMMMTPSVQAMAGHMPPAENLDGVARKQSQSAVTLSGTYKTAEDYIAALNANIRWVTYDKKTNTATISSVSDFMKQVKMLQKSVGAFDDLNTAQPENQLFGYNDGKGVHWDTYMTALLKGTAKGDAYAADLTRKDALGFSVAYRQNLYNPMYFVSPYYEGYKKSTPAQYWRIHAGIFQGDTAVSTELDLALALKAYGGQVKDVQFADVWGLPHVEAERSGTSTAQFIAWVGECLK